MLTSYLSNIITRELRALTREIQSFPDDDSLWLTPPGVGNSAGTLALHLAGNLQHYVGAALGGSAYRRDREAEFSKRNLSREELAREIERATAVVEQTLPRVTPDMLQADFPAAVSGQTIRAEEFLLHLVTHLAYHLGQLDYCRRLVTEDPSHIGAVSVKELTTARPEG